MTISRKPSSTWWCDPTFHAGKMDMRPSAKGTYLSLTVTVRATSREQLDNLYRALSSHPMVKVVL